MPSFLCSGHVHTQQAHSPSDGEANLYIDQRWCETGGRGGLASSGWPGAATGFRFLPGGSASISSPGVMPFLCICLQPFTAFKKSSQGNRNYADVRGLLATLAGREYQLVGPSIPRREGGAKLFLAGSVPRHEFDSCGHQYWSLIFPVIGSLLSVI